MDKQINDWLQKFDIIKKIAEYEPIHTENLEDDVKNLAMQRTGFEVLPTRYINEKCWHRRYSYMLLLKSESESDVQRLENNDWLDELTDALANANLEKSYPQIEGKECYFVDCANALTYQESEDGCQSIYSLQIYFNIKGGN